MTVLVVQALSCRGGSTLVRKCKGFRVQHPGALSAWEDTLTSGAFTHACTLFTEEMSKHCEGATASCATVL